MLIINFDGREVKGLSKGRYDKTFAGEDALLYELSFRCIGGGGGGGVMSKYSFTCKINAHSKLIPVICDCYLPFSSVASCFHFGANFAQCPHQVL